MPSQQQPSLYECLGVKCPAGEAASPGQLEVYDFFACAGGFSTGAAQAGCRVAYACDADPGALETHRRNHRRAQHECLTLPNARAVARLPTDGRRFHVHCSPPCVKFSSMNRVNSFERRTEAADKAHAVDLVAWSLETMLASRCTSWSLEQVACPEVIRAVERAARAHPGRVAWAKLDFSLLGVPQTRVRLVAGTPRLVTRLQRLCSKARRRTVRDVLPRPRGTHVRHGQCFKVKRLRARRGPGESKYVYDRVGWAENCRSVDRTAYTVRGHAHTWVTIRDGKAVDHSVLHPSELAALQTFPPNYKLPTRKRDAFAQVGNAVPPLVAKLLLEEEAA